MKMHIAEQLHGCGSGESNRHSQAQEWYTTEEAAVYLRTTVKALNMRVLRGAIVPDCRGLRGRGKQHMFRKSTLDAHYSGG
jgi:hypothetical protein